MARVSGQQIWPYARATHERNEFSRLGDETVSQLLVVFDKVGDVDITEIFLQKGVFAQLVSVNEDIVVAELEDEGDELLLELEAGVVALARVGLENGDGVDRLAIHDGARRAVAGGQVWGWWRRGLRGREVEAKGSSRGAAMCRVEEAGGARACRRAGVGQTGPERASSQKSSSGS